MGWGEERDNYRQYQDTPHENKAELSHEILAGGAAFLGMKMFEDHQRKEGKVVNHSFAKELVAGFAGAEFDRFAETKGEDWIDKERGKREAEKRAERMYDDHYGQYDQYNPQQQQPHEHLREHFRDERREGW